MDLCTKFRLIFESYFDFAQRELITGINASYVVFRLLLKKKNLFLLKNF